MVIDRKFDKQRFSNVRIGGNDISSNCSAFWTFVALSCCTIGTLFGVTLRSINLFMGIRLSQNAYELCFWLFNFMVLDGRCFRRAARWSCRCDDSNFSEANQLRSSGQRFAYFGSFCSLLSALGVYRMGRVELWLYVSVCTCSSYTVFASRGGIMELWNYGVFLSCLHLWTLSVVSA